jgi:hypothetical protein
VLGLREVTFPAFNEDDRKKAEESGATVAPFDIFPARRNLSDLRLIGCSLGTIYGRLIRCTADHVELYGNRMELMNEAAVVIEAKAELTVNQNRFLSEEWGALHLTPFGRLTLNSNIFESNRSDMLRLYSFLKVVFVM